MLASRQARARAAQALTRNAARGHRFSSANVELGPHPFSRAELVAREVHRIRSVKAGMTVVVVGSALEATAIYRAEGDVTVKAITARPLRVFLRNGTRPHHTFSLQECYADGTAVLLQVTRASALQRIADGRHVPVGWEALEAWSKHQGVRVDFVTDVDLEKDRILVANWRRLLPLVVTATETPEPVLEDELARVSQREGALAFDEFPRHVSEPDCETVYTAVARLLHQGRLEAPLATEQLRMNTIIVSSRDG